MMVALVLVSCDNKKDDDDSSALALLLLANQQQSGSSNTMRVLGITTTNGAVNFASEYQLFVYSGEDCQGDPIITENFLITQSFGERTRTRNNFTKQQMSYRASGDNGTRTIACLNSPPPSEQTDDGHTINVTTSTIQFNLLSN